MGLSPVGHQPHFPFHFLPRMAAGPLLGQHCVTSPGKLRGPQPLSSATFQRGGELSPPPSRVLAGGSMGADWGLSYSGKREPVWGRV